MCGICGAWRSDHPELDASLRASMTAMTHRGPDGDGLYTAPGIAIGMRRLAVIDVEGGHQPVWNERRDIAVIMNGEVYNHVELLEQARARGHTLASRSDTEAVVHLYEDLGTGVVDALRGMFAIAIVDQPRNRLVLFRDRFGKKPLYLTRTATGGLLFASELKALLPLMRAAGITPEIDPTAIYDYLSMGAVPQPGTAYRGVHTLPAGHRLIADEQGVREERYWSAPFEPKLQLSYVEAQARVRQEVGEAVRIRLRSDVPLGVFLSGGIDSTVVAFEATRHLGDTLQTFTIATDDPDVDESAVAARTAERFGIANTVLRLDVDPVRDLTTLVHQYDQPFADPSAIPSLRVAALARQHVTVVLNGDGGDELFGGYRRYVAAAYQDALGWLPTGAAAAMAKWLGGRSGGRRSALGFAARGLRGLGMPPALRYLAWTSDMLVDSDKRPAWRAGPTPRPTEDLVLATLDPRLPALDRQVAAEIALNLVSALLVKMDIATSAASLEGRSPFLDHRVADVALRLPARYRVRGRRTKAVLRDAYADALPSEVFRGAKRGFEVPLATWLAGAWRPLINDTVAAPDARIRAYLDDELISRATTAGGLANRNAAYVTYALLVLELWLRSGQP